MEGSGDEHTLAYFDQRRDRFRELLDLGGHAIIASHPDLSTSQLESLLGREELGDVWAAPIDRVVQRCRRVLGYSAISVAGGGPSPRLLSKHTLADVALRSYPAEGGAPTEHCTQLNAGVPREIGVTD